MTWLQVAPTGRLVLVIAKFLSCPEGHARQKKFLAADCQLAVSVNQPLSSERSEAASTKRSPDLVSKGPGGPLALAGGRSEEN